MELKQSRVLTYAIVTFILCGSYWLLKGSLWVGSREIHTIMEALATLLATCIGVLALIRFYAKQQPALLYLGAGFLGTAFLDGYHAVVTSTFFDSYFPSSPPSLIPWSWVASRLFLSICMFLSWWGWRFERNASTGIHTDDRAIYVLVAVLTLISFLFFTFAPMPRAYYPELFFHRPEELVPASFFFLALVMYLKEGGWKTDEIQHWIVLSLIVGLIGQVTFMSFSGQLFDMEFDVAHLLKKVSYVCVLTGLMVSIYRLYKDQESQRLELINSSNNLIKANQLLTDARGLRGAVLENMLDGVFIINTEGIIQYCNNAAPAMFGYEENDLLGNNISMLTPEPIRSKHDGYLKNYLDTGESKIIGIGRDVVGIRKNGEPINLHLSISQIEKEGEILFTGLLHDQTEQKAYEDALKKSNQALQDANRLKSEFLANMSHELRTPMNSILGFTGWVIKKSADILPKQQLKNLHTVDRNARHLLTLINDLLDISKIEAGRMDVFTEFFDLKVLIDEVMTLNKPLAEGKDLDLTLIVPDGELVIHSDQQKVRHILINLLSNAIKFTPSGSVTLQVDVPHILPSGEEWIKIHVTDTGIGIRENDRKFIFEAFRQADGSSTRSVGGTGLGLTICKSLTELLQGELTLGDQLKNGTAFTLSIPLHMDVKPSEKDKRKVNEIVGEGPLILCIDNDPDAIELMREVLVDEGYQVVGALSGNAGLEKAKSLKPEAITLDILMPEKDGWQLLRELKEDPSTSNIPVIMVSIVENRKWGYQLGAVDYLLKPVDTKALVDSLNRLRNPSDVLIVDDDPDVLDLLTQYFHDKQQHVNIATNGQQALEIIETSRPSLILLDLLMPIMDGFEFLKQLEENKELKDIPVIVMTAKNLTNNEKQLLNDRVEAIILKDGLSMDQLMSLITGQISKLTSKAS